MCAICFDSFTESAVLPCDCTVDYCRGCWDRSLAQAFNDSGLPRCPTCRSPIRVDFNAAKAVLVFSRESREIPTLDDLNAIPQGDRGRHEERERLAQRIAQMRDEMVERIAMQTSPYQVRLLEQFGAAHPELVDIATSGAMSSIGRLSVEELRRHITANKGSTEDCLEKKDLLLRLCESTGGTWGSVASYWAAAQKATGQAAEDTALAQPSCVCGASLTRLTHEERSRRYLETTCGVPASHPRYEEFLRSVMAHPSMICDVCENRIELGSASWTCDSGSSTILHALSYDVCDACFTRHALGQQEEAAAEDER